MSIAEDMKSITENIMVSYTITNESKMLTI